MENLTNAAPPVPLARFVLHLCGEILEWNDADTRPVKLCRDEANWKNTQTMKGSIRAICDSCAALRFPGGLDHAEGWERISRENDLAHLRATPKA